MLKLPLVIWKEWKLLDSIAREKKKCKACHLLSFYAWHPAWYLTSVPSNREIRRRKVLGNGRIGDERVITPRIKWARFFLRVISPKKNQIKVSAEVKKHLAPRFPALPLITIITRGMREGSWRKRSLSSSSAGRALGWAGPKSCSVVGTSLPMEPDPFGNFPGAKCHQHWRLLENGNWEINPTGYWENIPGLDSQTWGGFRPC